MAVDPKDREAYEEGVARSKMGFIEHFVQTGAEMIPGSHTRTESEQAAFEKGERGEQLDEDKEDSGGGCFLSTACVAHAGLSDDCPDLQTLRHFRDSYVITSAGGQLLISDYYAVAPRILAAIDRHPSRDDWYRDIFDRLVTPTVRLIQAQRHQDAVTHYRAYVEELLAALDSSNVKHTRRLMPQAARSRRRVAFATRRG